MLDGRDFGIGQGLRMVLAEPSTLPLVAVEEQAKADQLHLGDLFLACCDDWWCRMVVCQPDACYPIAARVTQWVKTKEEALSIPQEPYMLPTYDGFFKILTEVHRILKYPPIELKDIQSGDILLISEESWGETHWGKVQVTDFNSAILVTKWETSAEKALASPENVAVVICLGCGHKFFLIHRNSAEPVEEKKQSPVEEKKQPPYERIPRGDRDLIVKGDEILVHLPTTGEGWIILRAQGDGKFLMATHWTATWEQQLSKTFWSCGHPYVIPDDAELYMFNRPAPVEAKKQPPYDRISEDRIIGEDLILARTPKMGWAIYEAIGDGTYLRVSIWSDTWEPLVCCSRRKYQHCEIKSDELYLFSRPKPEIGFPVISFEGVHPEDDIIAIDNKTNECEAFRVKKVLSRGFLETVRYAYEADTKEVHSYAQALERIKTGKLRGEYSYCRSSRQALYLISRVQYDKLLPHVTEDYIEARRRKE